MEEDLLCYVHSLINVTLLPGAILWRNTLLSAKLKLL